MNNTFAEHFASDWIDSWNSHDLPRILFHYADDFVMTSPKIIQLADEPSGTLRGKAAVGAYWAKALQLIPDLHFELITTLVGVTASLSTTWARKAVWRPRYFILTRSKK